jgi:hypothetical protein
VRVEAAGILRSMIERIVLRPRPKGGLAANLVGDLAAILQVCERAENDKSPSRRKPEGPCQLSVVAGARNHRQLTIAV